jgi:hypothetical protein
MRAAIALCALLITTSAHAETESDSHPRVMPERDRYGWYVPDYARVQTGGYLGMFTVGVGYSAFRDVLNIGVTYGYVPPRDGAPSIHLGSAMLAVRPLRFALGKDDRYFLYPLYIGGGAFVASSPNTFVSQPEVYPPGYYPPTAFQPIFLFGAELSVRSNEGAAIARHSLFIEEVTIRQYISSMYLNHAFHIGSAFSTAIGYRASF